MQYISSMFLKFQFLGVQSDFPSALLAYFTNAQK